MLRDAKCAGAAPTSSAPDVDRLVAGSGHRVDAGDRDPEKAAGIERIGGHLKSRQSRLEVDALEKNPVEHRSLQPKLEALVAKLPKLPKPLGAVRRVIRPYPPEEVTTISERELEPQAGGVDREAIDAIWSSVETLYKTRIHPAIALCIRRNGRIIVDRAIGHAHGNSPGTPPTVPRELATPDHLYNLFSGSKSITAMLIHYLDDHGLLHVDDPVVEFIPEFGQGGKETITIRHLLSHRAGIPTTQGTTDLSLLDDRAKIRQLYCEAQAESVPGMKLAYHAITAGFVLADIIEIVTGKDVQQFLTEVIREPLGFENFQYGVPREKLPLVARDAHTGFKSFPPISTKFYRGFGATVEDVVEMGRDERYLTAVVPSGNIIATPHEVGRYFELLLRDGTLDGARIFNPRTVRRAVLPTSYGEIDGIIGLPIRYGMGFMLGAKYVSFYGYDSEKAFGHLGFSSVLAWADPERDISVSLMTTGKPLVTPESILWLNVPWTIARTIPKI